MPWFVHVSVPSLYASSFMAGRLEQLGPWPGLELSTLPPIHSGQRFYVHRLFQCERNVPLQILFFRLVSRKYFPRFSALLLQFDFQG